MGLQVGGISLLGPKITGRLYSETLSRIAAVTCRWLQLTFFRNSFLAISACRALSHLSAGIQCSMSCPRRALPFSALGYLPADALPDLVHALRQSRRPESLPHRPRWKTDSPPPTENFHVTPEVTWEPYDFLNRPDLGLAAGSPLPAPAHGDD